MEHLKRWWPWLVGGGAVVILVTWVMRASPQVVDVGTVSRGPLTVTIDEEGETRVRDRYQVAAPVSGRVRRITLEAGDSVRAGTAVAVLESSPLDPRTRHELDARLEAALDAERMTRTTVVQAREALDQAEREHARIEALFRQNVVAPEVRERAALTETSRRRDLEAADFRAQAASHDAEQARAAVASTAGSVVTLRSPTRGRVLRVVEPSERVVAAGSPLLELGNPSQLEIVAAVLSTDATLVTPGDTIQVIDWGGPDTLVAILRRVEPSGFTRRSALGVEEQRVNIVGSIVTVPPALGDRYRANVRVVIWRATDVLRVPRTALFRAGDQWRTFVVESGRARERLVTVGRQALDLAEVTGGVAAGDSVILHPDERIVEGTRVRPRPPADR